MVESLLAKKGLQAVAERESRFTADDVDANQDVAILASLAVAARETGGVEQPEEVGAEGEVGSEAIEDNRET